MGNKRDNSNLQGLVKPVDIVSEDKVGNSVWY